MNAKLLGDMQWLLRFAKSQMTYPEQKEHWNLLVLEWREVNAQLEDPLPDELGGLF